MIFVDTNVFMYAVGRPHSLRNDAQRFFEDGRREGKQLVTSAEVLQELGAVLRATYDTDLASGGSIRASSGGVP